MNILKQWLGIFSLSIILMSCSSSDSELVISSDGHGKTLVNDVVKGPHGGRLLSDGNFTLELAIFETGVPPEFRAWASEDGKQLKPDEVALKVNLTRLGGKVDEINFKPQADAMRGDMVIYEPHSFEVSIHVKHKGQIHQWHYENFEGRTRIEPVVAEALGIETSVAGPAALQEVINVYGQVLPDAGAYSQLSARYPGVIKSVVVSVGDKVKQGQILATIESNENLSLYQLKAPINGVITQRNASPGVQTDGRILFEVIDTSTVWVDLSIFPSDLKRVQEGSPVTVINPVNGMTVESAIASINQITESNQAVKARVILSNNKAAFLPGSFVSAQIEVAEYSVPLAVKRTGLQGFRDFTVVYAQINDEYEVRMLELGRQDQTWVEVLGGLEPGTHYVSANSYVIKADIEKSGASHDH